MNGTIVRRSVLTLVLALTSAGLNLADVTKGLVAHWRLDETGSGNVTDSAGKHHGTNHGADRGQPGLNGQAFRFSHKEDDYIDCGNTLQLDGGNSMTVSALVRPQSFNPQDFKNRANSRNGILGTVDANFIFALTDRGRLTFVWDAGTNDYQTIVTATDMAVPLAVYSHVAAVRDGSKMALYVNGVARETRDGFSPKNFVPFGRMQLGRVNNSAARDFDGLIDDVRVYSRALSANEVKQLAEAVKLADVAIPVPPLGSRGLQRVKYNHPGLVVDLGVGLWARPLPMDYDRDGDWDLLVSCADVPYNGVYFFENAAGDVKFPTFKPAVRIAAGLRNAEISYVHGKARLLVPGHEYRGVGGGGLGSRVKLPVDPKIHTGKIRANQWKYADYDADGRLDLVVGIGDWTEYGWDNAFNADGQWTRGPLHGYVYLLHNRGSSEKPQYDKPIQVQAGGEPIDVFGMPSPSLADFDGDGDLDILCGEFVDKLTYFENVGTRTQPKYVAGRLLTHRGEPLRLDLCMILPTAIDWDKDGDVDLIVGEEDGRVALLENTGKLSEGTPAFLPPKHFRQEADELKFGALVTPVSFDWDDDGDEDLVCGNTAGYIGWIENLDAGNPPKWAAPKYLQASGQAIRIQAGINGSIQGPCEAKWGYTTLSVADWNHDGLPDLVVNSIWGKVVWYRNNGTRKNPKLLAAEPVEVLWPGKPPKPAWNWWNPKGKQLATQWRTTPVVIDWTGDGLNDLVMLDVEGYLALYERVRNDSGLRLLPPKRVFVDPGGKPLRLNSGLAGRSGRRKLCCVDWDGDQRLDLLINARNVELLRNAGERDGKVVLENKGALDPRRLAGHTTSPTTVDWDRDGTRDLLVGAEDGCLYYLKNPHSKVGRE